MQRDKSLDQIINERELRRIERDQAIEIAFKELKKREFILSAKENLLEIIQGAIDTIIFWSDPKNELELVQHTLSDLTTLRDLINNKETYWN